MESSLTSHIFGSSSINASSDEEKKTLSVLFESSSSLPKQPCHSSFNNPKSNTIARNNKKRSDDLRNDSTNVSSTANVFPNALQDKEVDERTIFVGNLPINTTKKELGSLFKSCGSIHSARIRSVATTGVKVSKEEAKSQKLIKKTAALTKKLTDETPKQSSQGYVVFERIESVAKALKMNNHVLKDEYGNSLRLRVDYATPTVDSSRSVFVGNLPHKSDEMSLNEHFRNGCKWEDDHAIEGVRLIRDSSSMQCKGIGYILLKDKTLVPDALKMHETMYMDRVIRVMVCGKKPKKDKGRHRKDRDVDTKETGAFRRLKEKAGKTSKDDGAIRIPSTSKEKKKRGSKKGAKNGVSKRAASNKKVDRRVKKLQKRISKGMGKAKKA